MKRAVKNILIIVIIGGLGVGTYFTMNYAKDHISSSTSDTSQTSSNGAPSGDNNGTPPAIPGGDNSSGDNGNMTSPPDKPNNDSTNSSDMTQPPAKPDGSSSNDSANSDNSSSSDSSSSNNETPQMGDSIGGMPSGGPGVMPGQSNDGNSADNELDAIYYVVFGVESFIIAVLLMYLIMSRFNKKSFKETISSADKAIIYILSVVVITGALTFADSMITDKYFLNSGNQTSVSGEKDGSSSNVTATAANTIDGEDKTLDGSYTSSESDESVILVKNGGNLTLKNATVNKSGGDSSNTENSEFYGINAGVLVTKGSTAKISGTKITTNAKGSNAVFSTGEDSKIYISDSTIVTKGSSSSRGLDATYGGYIEADNVNITTSGGSCATLATDRGEGTVKATNSVLETNGSGSPVIYSTGDISITDTKGTANGSQMVVIEGKNSATVTSSTLVASGKGNRNDVDNAGVMIYQSMSGDASEGTGTFTAKNSSLSIDSSSDYYKSAPMFFVTNTDAVINLTNSKLSYGSGVLVSAKGTSEWGTSGSNGGNLTLNATKQTLKGNIEVDKISTLDMTLKSSSTYTGIINGDNSAKSIKLTLDKSSKIVLTGDSYVTSLDDADSSYSNIDFNGYKLYVNGKAIN